MSRICSGAGCGRKVPDGVRFCDECKKERAGKTDGIQVHKPDRGGSQRAHSTGYDRELDKLNQSARWHRVRARVLVRDPFCVKCGAPACEVDHIVPAGVAVQQARDSGRYLDQYAGYFFLSNLQGLCRSCHARKTLEDKAHVGEWPDVMAAEDAGPKKTWTF